MKVTLGSLSRRTLLKSTAATVLASSTAFAARAQGAAKLIPIKVAASVPVFTQAPTFLLKPLKLDAKHGLDVEVLQMGGNSSLMIETVVSRNADFANAGGITVLQAIRAGADLVILGAFSNNQIASVISKTAMAKTGLTDSSPAPDKIRAMKGMTIATNPQGASYTQIFRGYLQKYGLDPDKDVRLIYIADTQAMVSGIDQGRFDAIVSAAGGVEPAITLGSGAMWFSGASGEFPGSDAEVTAVSVARRETVEKNPQLVNAFRAAMQDGLDVLNNDREKTVDLLYKEYFNKMDPAVWKLILDKTKKGFPTRLIYPRAVFDYWTAADPKGAESYKDVDYNKITYGPARS